PSLSQPAIVRPGYRTVVQTENPGHDVSEFLGYRQWAGASAKNPPADFVALEFGAECGGQVRDGAGEFDRAFGQAGLHHGQIVLMSEGVDFREIVGIGATRSGELLASEIAALVSKSSVEQQANPALSDISDAAGSATNQDGYFDWHFRIKFADDSG